MTNHIIGKLHNAAIVKTMSYVGIGGNYVTIDLGCVPKIVILISPFSRVYGSGSIIYPKVEYELTQSLAVANLKDTFLTITAVSSTNPTWYCNLAGYTYYLVIIA